MELGLQDKVAVVTGASRGIGRSIARQLAGEGMRLLVTARSADALAELALEFPGRILPLALDLREPDAPARMIKAAAEHFGQLDVLVNNAGATRRGDFLTLNETDWEDGFALKFYAAVRAARAAWPLLMASRGGVINIVGVGGRTGSAEFAIGGAVNAALLNFTKVLADRGVQDGVRVNAINPGSIATERLQTRIRQFAEQHGLGHEEAARQLAARQGTAGFGQPEDIARAVAFLASNAACYCQGSILDVDGGQTRTL